MLQRGIPLTRTSKWWAGAPAKLAGLDGRKGHLAAGFDADIVVRTMCPLNPKPYPANSMQLATGLRGRCGYDADVVVRNKYPHPSKP